MRKLLQLITITTLISVQVFASGFQINEHGARGMAMAGAYTALALDGSALYYNPAGLSQLSGTQFMLGTTLISPSAAFRGVTPNIDEYNMESALFTPINLYITHQLSEKMTFGFGVNNQYGLGSKWEEDWIGKYLAIDTEIQTFYFTGGASYKLSDAFSIGATFSYVYGNVTILKKNPLTPFQGDAEIDLEGTAGSYAYSAGLLFTPSDVLSIGLDFRSGTSMNFSGTAEVIAPQALLDAQQIPNGSVEAPLTLPYNATIGIALKPSDALTISLDYQYVGWSSYDKMEITFEDFLNEEGDPYVSTAIRDYTDGSIVRLGMEYSLNENFDLRSGILYDYNPVKDEYVEPS
ncbi:MAG: outer membrane protein transport protein, partial [Bacteroidota bacterium]